MTISTGTAPKAATAATAATTAVSEPAAATITARSIFAAVIPHPDTFAYLDTAIPASKCSYHTQEPGCVALPHSAKQELADLGE
jgi:hypothetical protein